MRYSIMLQLVAGTTVVLVGAAALFAWIQNRTESIESRQDPVSLHIIPSDSAQFLMR